MCGEDARHETEFFRQNGGDIVDVGAVCDLPETVRHALVVGKGLRGRRGGSNVAAAIVNALLYGMEGVRA